VTEINTEFVAWKQEAHVIPGVEQSFEEDGRFYLFNTLKPCAILFPTKRKNSFDVANLNSYMIIHKPRA
jgi:hypothetical protein